MAAVGRGKLSILSRQYLGGNGIQARVDTLYFDAYWSNTLRLKYVVGVRIGVRVPTIFQSTVVLSKTRTSIATHTPS